MLMDKIRKKLDSKSMEIGPDACPIYSKVPVTAKSGNEYYIPVDSDGYVPTWALVSRFQDVLTPFERQADIEDDTVPILPSRLTPEECIEWWEDPLSCDISNIDTKDPEIYDVSFTKNERLREIHRRIAVITPTRKEQARIRREISKAFDEDELNEMTSRTSFIIQTIPNGGNAAGVYLRKQWDIPVPIVVYEEGTSPDSIVHEAVHHMRTMLSRNGKGVAQSTFPVNKEGAVDLTTIAKMTSKDRERMQSVEEAATVAETMIRTKRDRYPSGYYDDVPSNKTPRQMYDEDNLKLGDGSDIRIRGKKVVDRVISEFDSTHIAEAMIMSRESAKVAAKKLYSGKKGKA